MNHNGHSSRGTSAAAPSTLTGNARSLAPADNGRSDARSARSAHNAADTAPVRSALNAVSRMVSPAAVATRSGAASLGYGCTTLETSQVLRAGYARGDAARSAEQQPRTTEPLALSALDQQRFHMLYREHFDFVFRNLRRLGVAPASLDDALQDVYLVVLRRLGDLQHDEHLKAWLFAIIFRVAGNHRRTARRRGTPEPLSDTHLCSQQPGPFDLTARAQASEFLHGFLSTLDDNRRAVFVMAELEQLTAPEIAEALSANVNTVYSWLRAGRIAFEKALRQVRRAQDVRSHG